MAELVLPRRMVIFSADPWDRIMLAHKCPSMAGDYRRTPDFASSQIAGLLEELHAKSSSQSAKVRTLTRFRDFLETSKPEVYDDDVDVLLIGNGDDESARGLLYYAGAISENSKKEANALKRISAEAIGLLHFLVFLPEDVIEGMCEGYDDEENIFYSRFINMSIDDLRRVNFARHIIHLPSKQQKGGLDKLFKKLETAKADFLKGGSRTGNPELAMNLLALLIRDHACMINAGADEVAALVQRLLTPPQEDEGEGQALSDEVIATCRDIFNSWFNMRATEFAAGSKRGGGDGAGGNDGNDVAEFGGSGAVAGSETMRPFQEKDPFLSAMSSPEVLKSFTRRATAWADVLFVPVPLQEGEQGATAGAEKDEEREQARVQGCRDPLGLVEVDLPSLQAAQLKAMAVTREQKQEKHTRAALGLGHSKSASVRELRSSMLAMDTGVLYVRSPGSKNSASPFVKADGGAMAAKPGGVRARGSSFAAETAAQLEAEDAEAKADAEKESSIVPTDKNFDADTFLAVVHGNTAFDKFGEGLANLHLNVVQRESLRENLVREYFGLFVDCSDGLQYIKESACNKDSAGLTRPEAKLLSARRNLDKAHERSKNVLAPILERMDKSRRLRKAQQVMYRLAPTLEHPHKMQQALRRGDYEEVLVIFDRLRTQASGYGADDGAQDKDASWRSTDLASVRFVTNVLARATAVVDDLREEVLATLTKPLPANLERDKAGPKLAEKLRCAHVVVAIDESCGGGREALVQALASHMDQTREEAGALVVSLAKRLHAVGPASAAVATGGGAGAGPQEGGGGAGGVSAPGPAAVAPASVAVTPDPTSSGSSPEAQASQLRQEYCSQLTSLVGSRLPLLHRLVELVDSVGLGGAASTAGGGPTTILPPARELSKMLAGVMSHVRHLVLGSDSDTEVQSGPDVGDGSVSAGVGAGDGVDAGAGAGRPDTNALERGLLLETCLTKALTSTRELLAVIEALAADGVEAGAGADGHKHQAPVPEPSPAEALATAAAASTAEARCTGGFGEGSGSGDDGVYGEISSMLRAVVCEGEQAIVVRTLAHVRVCSTRLVRRWLDALLMGHPLHAFAGRGGLGDRERDRAPSTPHGSGATRRLEVVSALDFSTAEAHAALDVVLGKQPHFLPLTEAGLGLGGVGGVGSTGSRRSRTPQALALDAALVRLTAAQEAANGSSNSSGSSGSGSSSSSGGGGALAFGARERSKGGSSQEAKSLAVGRLTAAAVVHAVERMVLCALWRTASRVSVASTPALAMTVATALTATLNAVADTLASYSPLGAQALVGDGTGGEGAAAAAEEEDELEALDRALGEGSGPRLLGSTGAGAGTAALSSSGGGARAHTRAGASSHLLLLLRCLVQWREDSVARLWKAAMQAFPSSDWRAPDLGSAVLAVAGSSVITPLAAVGLRLDLGPDGRVHYEGIDTEVAVGAADGWQGRERAVLHTLLHPLEGTTAAVAVSSTTACLHEAALATAVAGASLANLRECVYAGYAGMPAHAASKGSASRLNRLLLLLALQRRDLRDALGTYSVTARSCHGSGSGSCGGGGGGGGGGSEGYAHFMTQLVHAGLLEVYEDLARELDARGQEWAELFDICEAEYGFLATRVFASEAGPTAVVVVAAAAATTVGVEGSGSGETASTRAAVEEEEPELGLGLGRETQILLLALQ